MRQNMLKIIATSKKADNFDIFSTITYSPQWPEIKNPFLPGQSVADYPDLAARFFRMKLRVLMAFVIDEKVFGHVKGICSDDKVSEKRASTLELFLLYDLGYKCCSTLAVYSGFYFIHNAFKRNKSCCL